MFVDNTYMRNIRKMNGIIDVYGSSEKVKKYHLLQFENFQFISKIFEEYVLGIGDEGWKEIVKELENVLSRCDEIDYQNDETAIAYAIWHFLDRYHRIQIMCDFLLKRGYLNRVKQYDVLDIGTGPSQVLFALSDHFQNLNKIEKQVLCTFNPDYAEQSQGFRNFLHHFVEYALGKKKQYLVPFHWGRTQDAFDISFRDYTPFYNTKYRYDLVVFNNFLTQKGFVEEYADTLRKICKYMRNHGMVIIIGASDKSEKYQEIYPIIDNIINKPFKGRNFYGCWKKVVDREFNYKYEDAYGIVLGEYFRNIVKYLKDSNLWKDVPKKAQKEFEENSSIPMSEEKMKKWNGSTWKMVVYKKISRPDISLMKRKKLVHKNYIRLVDEGWKEEITK